MSEDGYESAIRAHFRSNMWPAIESEELVKTSVDALFWLEQGADIEDTVVTTEDEYWFETSQRLGDRFQVVCIGDLIHSLHLEGLVSEETWDRITLEHC